MPSKKPGLPRLRISSLDDADDLARKIDVVLRADPELRRRARRIRKAQEELRAKVGEDAFAIYMKLEEAVTARDARALDVVAVWAFTEGLRVGAGGDIHEDP